MIRAVQTGIVLGITCLVLLGPAPAYSDAPAHLAIRYGDQALAFFSGYISDDVPVDGVLHKTTFNRQLMGQGDIVYLRMHYPDEVAVGSLYTMYRRVHKVFHPIDRRYLGNLIAILAVVEIKRIDDDLATAKVVRAYSSVSPGDAVMPLVLPSMLDPNPAAAGLPDTPGIIVDVQPSQTLIAQRHFVYLDWGRMHGLRGGERLNVLRRRAGFPTEPIGQVKVLGVEDSTATAIIVRSTVPFGVGDLVVPSEPRDAASTAPTSSKLAGKKTHDDLTRSLGAEIATGDVSVETMGDTLKINLNDLVGQLEYEPGEAQIKRTGLKVLKQIADYLKEQTDDQILVEGHTDNMPIGPTLVKRFATNQALSEARANLVVRYFVDQGIDATLLSAIGHAAARPVASNTTEEGRKRNRRIAIILSPTRTPPEPRQTQDRMDAPLPEAFHINIPATVHPAEEPQPQEAQVAPPTPAE